MIDKFDTFFDRLMGHEGGYVNHPNDPGGATRWGITERVARAHGYRGDMRHLPKSTAEEITKKSYYHAVRGGELEPAVAWQLMDAAYNHGVRQAVKFLQKAIGFTGNDVDGIIGTHTLNKVAQMDKNDVILLFLAERLSFYTQLKTWQSFGRGWTRRIADNLRYAASDN